MLRPVLNQASIAGIQLVTHLELHARNDLIFHDELFKASSLTLTLILPLKQK
tara:strand:- start:389 stop:544 length:156 start_codon:yes stop_codon:yes gene_type:complete